MKRLVIILTIIAALALPSTALAYQSFSYPRQTARAIETAIRHTSHRPANCLVASKQKILCTGWLRNNYAIFKVRKVSTYRVRMDVTFPEILYQTTIYLEMIHPA